mmetsp:Transcript_14040/g.37426  ORF Transcript_14040/g.37426 Transcript_14040/m.37426 type:complete len:203 (-) Transcript_14040:494-1102(-)
MPQVSMPEMPWGSSCGPKRAQAAVPSALDAGGECQCPWHKLRWNEHRRKLLPTALGDRLVRGKGANGALLHVDVTTHGAQEFRPGNRVLPHDECGVARDGRCQARHEENYHQHEVLRDDEHRALVRVGQPPFGLARLLHKNDQAHGGDGRQAAQELHDVHPSSDALLTHRSRSAADLNQLPRDDPNLDQVGDERDDSHARKD